jgi:hypothetical protein
MANLMDKYAVADLEKLNNPAIAIVLERYRDTEASLKNSIAIVKTPDFSKEFRAMVEDDIKRRLEVSVELGALVRQLHYTLCRNPTKWDEQDVRGAIERLKGIEGVIDDVEEAIDRLIQDSGWTRNELGENRCAT